MRAELVKHLWNKLLTVSLQSKQMRCCIPLNQAYTHTHTQNPCSYGEIILSPNIMFSPLVIQNSLMCHQILVFWFLQDKQLKRKATATPSSAPDAVPLKKPPAWTLPNFLCFPYSSCSPCFSPSTLFLFLCQHNTISCSKSLVVHRPLPLDLLLNDSTQQICKLTPAESVVSTGLQKQDVANTKSHFTFFQQF